MLTIRLVLVRIPRRWASTIPRLMPQLAPKSSALTIKYFTVVPRSPPNLLGIWVLALRAIHLRQQDRPEPSQTDYPEPSSLARMPRWPIGSVRKYHKVGSNPSPWESASPRFVPCTGDTLPEPTAGLRGEDARGNWRGHS